MEKPGQVRWPVKVWWYFHAIFILFYTFPQAPPAVLSGKAQGAPIDEFLAASDRVTRLSPLRYYMLSTGLWQYWDMFAPDPLSVDGYMSANVRYADGTITTEGNYPRIAAMPIPQKYVSERYRKFLERSASNSTAYMWPILAQRIALNATKDPNNPVIEVQLVRHFRAVGPPGQDPDAGKFKEYVFYTYVVPKAKGGQP